MKRVLTPSVEYTKNSPVSMGYDGLSIVEVV